MSVRLRWSWICNRCSRSESTGEGFVNRNCGEDCDCAGWGGWIVEVCDVCGVIIISDKEG